MQVIVNIATVDTQLAAGQTLADWVIDILDVSGAVVQSQPATAPSATFDISTDGVYTAQAKRIDSTGALFGSVAVSIPFTIAAPQFGQSASSVTVTVS
jgi:hypothetical protein